MEFEIFKILYRINYSDCYFFYYQYNVITVLDIHFSQLILNVAYFKACFVVHKIRLPFFINTNILNHYVTWHEKIGLMYRQNLTSFLHLTSV